MLKLNLILFLIPLTIINRSSCNKNERIIIIGAGASGISAASKLFENGYKNVQILEAEPRIGGRVYTQKFRDSFIELGAQFVHGEKGNVVYELANPLSLIKPSVLDIGDFEFFKFDGTKLPLQHGFDQMKIFIAINDNEEFATSLETIKNYITKEYQKRWRADENSLTYMTEDLEKQFLLYFENFIISNDAMYDWSDSNGIGYNAYEECEGSQSNIWNLTGYKILFDILMKKYPDPSKDLNIEENILLNTTVNKISIVNNEITVKTIEGKSYTADKVLVTVSLGVLKNSYKDLFEPKLPEINRRAIENLSFGTVNKILLEYSQPWWPSNWTSANILCTEEDQLKFGDERKWLKNIAGVFRFDDQPNLLSVWIGGKSSLEMETKSNEEVLKEMNFIISKVVEKEHGVTITEPIKMIRTNWGSQPNFRGSYSYRGVSASNAGVTNKDLATPVNVNGKNVVFFAGEATHNKHYSTVHGAVETGVRAANEIMEQ